MREKAMTILTNQYHKVVESKTPTECIRAMAQARGMKTILQELGILSKAEIELLLLTILEEAENYGNKNC